MLIERTPNVVATVAAADAAGAVAPLTSSSSSSISTTDVHIAVFGVGGLVGDVVRCRGFIDLWWGWGGVGGREVEMMVVCVKWYSLNG